MSSAPEIYVAKRLMTPAPVSGTGAIVVVEDRILDAGGVSEVRAKWSRRAVTHDLGEVTLVPGFNDAHQHPVTAAEYRTQVDIGQHGLLDYSGVLDLIRDRVMHTPRGEWVQAIQYDEAKVDGPVVSRNDLDRISTEHPILLGQISGHWGVLNSRALALGEFGDDSPNPPGGELGRGSDGRLDGRVFENAYFLYTLSGAGAREAIIPPPSQESRLRGLAEVSHAYHAAGLTSVTDAVVTPDSLDLYRATRARGEQTLRVNMLVGYPFLESAAALGIASGEGDDWLRVGGFKAFLDGAISGRTAWLREPYEGSEDVGIRLLEDAELSEVVSNVHRRGATLAVHANGDAAISLLLDHIELAQARWPNPTLRHRVEHCTVIDAQIIERLRGARMFVTPFATFLPAHGEKLSDWYGSHRLERMFAHRSLLDGGVGVAGASDHPVAPYEPLLGIQSCVTRADGLGRVLGASQRISVVEALGVYTAGSAAASGQYHSKGRLAPGQLADFVVLGGDLLTCDPFEIARMPVLATFVGGREVWSR